MKYNRNIICLIIIMVSLTYICAYSQIADYAPNQLIVKMKPHKTSNQKAQLKSQMNAKSIKTLTRNNIEVWQIDTPQANIERLVRQYRHHPDIELVEPNYIWHT